MKTIYTLQDLEPYGVNLLTGEADRLSFRILCDLNEDGCALVSDYLGQPRDTKYADNWNSTVNGQPAIGSVMLSADTLWELARFALLTVDRFDASDGRLVAGGARIVGWRRDRVGSGVRPTFFGRRGARRSAARGRRRR